MAKDMFLFWGSGSPPCWRIMIALEEKNLQGYQHKLLSFEKGEHKSQEVLDVNPRGQIIVNGVHFHDYKHRFSASRVENIFIDGGVEIHSVTIQTPAVMVVCDMACYRIVVNGLQMFTYNHRHGNHEEMDILEVAGDVSLSSVQL